MKDFRSELVTSIRCGVNKRLPINGWWLSVQAHDLCMCHPRVNGLSVFEYDHFEIALFTSSDRTAPFLNIATLFPELELKQSDASIGYVEVTKVQELFELLHKRCVPENVHEFAFNVVQASTKRRRKKLSKSA